MTDLPDYTPPAVFGVEPATAVNCQHQPPRRQARPRIQELPIGEHPYSALSLATPNWAPKSPCCWKNCWLRAQRRPNMTAWLINIRGEGDQFGSALRDQPNSKIPAMIGTVPRCRHSACFESVRSMLHLARSSGEIHPKDPATHDVCPGCLADGQCTLSGRRLLAHFLRLMRRQIKYASTAR